MYALQAGHQKTFRRLNVGHKTLLIEARLGFANGIKTLTGFLGLMPNLATLEKQHFPRTNDLRDVTWVIIGQHDQFLLGLGLHS
jgi:hypothetical protein